MLFNNFIALAFAAAPALALPREDLAQALDITVKFHSTTVCDDSGGPDRDYVSGTCLSLPESSHGVRIISRQEGCRLRRFVESDCSGDSTEIDDTACYDIGDVWGSLRFECDP